MTHHRRERYNIFTRWRKVQFQLEIVLIGERPRIGNPTIKSNAVSSNTSHFGHFRWIRVPRQSTSQTYWTDFLDAHPSRSCWYVTACHSMSQTWEIHLSCFTHPECRFSFASSRPLRLGSPRPNFSSRSSFSAREHRCHWFSWGKIKVYPHISWEHPWEHRFSQHQQVIGYLQAESWDTFFVDEMEVR